MLERRFAALSALRWLPVGLIVPVLVLVIQARGWDLAATGRLIALYSAVTLLLELPTGGLADVVGRRSVLVASSVFSAVGASLLAFGTNLTILAAAIVSLAVGRALGSGPLEAWFVDAVRLESATADIRRGLAAGQTAEAAALGVGAVAGGLIPAWVSALRPGTAPFAGTAFGTVIPLSVPFLLASALFVVHAIAVLLLVHDPRVASGEAAMERPRVRASIGLTMKEGLQVTTTNAGIRRILLYTGVLGFTLSGVELLSPGHVAGLLGGAEAGGAAYGVLVAVGFGASALGAWLAPRLVRPTSGADPRAWSVIFTLGSAAAVCIVGVPLMGAVAVAFTLTYLFIGLAGPLIAEMLHDRVGSEIRSTTLSLQSLTLQGGGLIASLFLGMFADAVGVGPAFVVIGVTLALGSLLLPPRATTHGAE